jgi:hypothetical protein
MIGELLEITVLIVIILELFALYRHSKIDRRIDEHLVKTDTLINRLDIHLERFGVNLELLEEHLEDQKRNLRE